MIYSTTCQKIAVKKLAKASMIDDLKFHCLLIPMSEAVLHRFPHPDERPEVSSM